MTLSKKREIEDLMLLRVQKLIFALTNLRKEAFKSLFYVKNLLSHLNPLKGTYLNGKSIHVGVDATAFL